MTFKLLTRPVLVLLLFAVATVTTVGAQHEKVRFDSRSQQAGDIITKIESQTGYKIAFTNTIFDTQRAVTLTDTEMSLVKALDEMVSGTQVDYVIRGSYIALVPKKQPAEPQVPVQRTDEVYVPTDYSSISASPVVRPEKGHEKPLPQIVEDLQAKMPVQYSDYRPLNIYGGLQESLPRFAIKTNLLYGGLALAPNLAFEFATGPKQTIEISGSYNGWERDAADPDDTKQMVHSIFRGEYRWWLCERFNGHFFGAHAMYARYQVSAHKIPLLFEKDYRYDGYAFGIGGTYGYNLTLGKRWGLEFNVGVGAAYMKFDRYTCAACDRDAEKKNKWYFGPTRAGITLTFLIK